MADNTSNNTSGRKDWRNRVGVKNGMPKLSNEFKSEPRISAASAKTPQNAPAARPAPKAVKAPMAPRRPAKVVAAPPRAANRIGSAPKPAPAAANPITGDVKTGDDFSARLREQRQAAEALAKKRALETRQRLSGARAGGGGPRFSFADEELKAAKSEVEIPASTTTPRAPKPTPVAKPTPAPAPKLQTPPPPPSQVRRNDSSRSVPVANPGAAPAATGQPRTYQPSEAYRHTHGYREYDDQSSRQAPVPTRNMPDYSDPRYNETDAGAPAQRPPQRSVYRGAHGRDPGYYDDNAEMFEAREPRDPRDPRAGSPRPAARNAGAEDYAAAYRDYDDAFEYEDEKGGRSGVWIFLVLMLLVVMAIGAGAYYWVKNTDGLNGTQKPASGVPTITAPQAPVKVTPTPTDKTVPGQPVRRKKIYDRILGDQTLEPEKLVPTEEPPVAPPVTVQPANPGETPSGVQPLPLPLPPPPVIPGQQGSLSPKTGKVASGPPGSSLGQTTIAPTGTNINPQTMKKGGQQAPLPLPPTVTGTQAEVPATGEPTATPTPAEVATPAPPLPRSKPASILVQARQDAERQRLAALSRVTPPAASQPVAPALPFTGSGPVQLAPGTPGSGQNFTSRAATPRVVTPTPRKRTNIASAPQTPASTPKPQATTGGQYVLQLSSFRNRSEATAEYQRLLRRHPGILGGLAPQIQEADLGASGKFYKLRVGSVASRSQAAKLCNSLIAAGEKDCLVRKN